MSSNLKNTPLNSQENTLTSLAMTFYSWPDNDPPGNAISYPIIHKVAGGTGTYDDPITVAVVTKDKGGNWSPGTLMYVPSLKKYLIVEDECASCVPDQIDVWMNSDANFPSEVLECQKTWTPKEPVEVEINPPADHEVITTPLFDISTGKCSNPSFSS